jgi:PAS domain S-box-containing protein
VIAPEQIIIGGRDILASTSVRGNAVIDQNFRCLWANEQMGFMTGLMAPEHVGKTVEEITPLGWKLLRDEFQRAAKGEAIYDRRVTTETEIHGIPKTWSLNLVPVIVDGSQCGTCVYVHDVTEEVRVSKQLQLNTRLTTMFAHTNRAVTRSRSVDELFPEVCRIAVEVGGFRWAWIGVPDAGIVRQAAAYGDDGGYAAHLVVTTADDDPRSHGPTGRAARQGMWTVVNDFVASAMTGPWHGIAEESGMGAAAAFPILDGGTVKAVLSLYSAEAGYFTPDMLATLQEIVLILSLSVQALAQKEDLLREHEALRMRDHAIEGVSQGMAITSRTDDGPRIVYVNGAFERLTGYRAADLIGKPPPDFRGPNTDPASAAALLQGLAEDLPVSTELLLYRADGSTFWADVFQSTVPGLHASERQWVTILNDRTESRILEEQLQRSQRVEAIGRLAAGVAHDFNNLLTVMSASADLALRRLDDEHPAKRQVLAVQDAVRSAGRVTRQLLLFSRQQSVHLELIDLAQLVVEMEGLLTRLIGNGIAVTTTLAPDTGFVRADRGQLEQVLVNLAVNAAHAMPTGGELRIRTRESRASECESASLGDNATCVVLEVEDTGTGIEDSVRPHVFEPFFTTKGPGEGTGIGLAVVEGVVTRAGGTITFDSVLGKGTTFRIVLPRCEDEAPVNALESASDLPRGDEQLLLVEPDGGLRAKLAEVLTLCGYALTEAVNGDQALALAERHDTPFDLVILAVVMPGISGRELAAKFVDAAPRTKVLFMSGYPDEVLERWGVARDDFPFIEKPFAPEDLARRVRTLLDGPSAAGAPAASS